MFAEYLTLALFFVVCITIDVMGDDHNQLAMNLNELPFIIANTYYGSLAGFIHHFRYPQLEKMLRLKRRSKMWLSVCTCWPKSTLEGSGISPGRG
jgi:hypothetical protein